MVFVSEHHVFVFLIKPYKENLLAEGCALGKYQQVQVCSNNCNSWASWLNWRTVFHKGVACVWLRLFAHDLRPRSVWPRFGIRIAIKLWCWNCRIWVSWHNYRDIFHQGIVCICVTFSYVLYLYDKCVAKGKFFFSIYFLYLVLQ